MAVLVTGGAGYIGSHTAKALLAGGREVVVLDDFTAGHRAACAALATIAAPGQLTVVEAAIGDSATVESTCRQHGVDASMHFAAWLSVAESVTDPAGYYRNNVTGSIGLFEGLSRAGVTRLIFSSTCATYGEPQRVPIDETHPQQPINAYGETKLAVERALPHFETAYGLRSIALRYFNAAGADPDGLLGEDHDPEIHIIPRAIFAATGTDTLKVFGEDYPTPDGTCLRDYIHVTDLADAHVRALESLEGGGPSARFNVGTGTPHSVKEVIDAVGRVSGRAVPYTVGPRRPGDPSTLYAANGAIRSALGWTPRYADLDAIVGTAWRWFEAHPNGYGD
ncbi:UDP-glucose 4-epimerase [Luteitalea pratensis]|uniref:UDP-glucose 4-epimerase n=1 Tax=Luteitalea pratensis TaxID=1855912 RepID=A0A143PR38_LUTPR|nr:UDP-glucose 4-epimerase GalE [Luteitalea pratensis]AMY10598.1 UDP-glucose 4-epimerase [Luteitalea pratensis]